MRPKLKAITVVLASIVAATLSANSAAPEEWPIEDRRYFITLDGLKGAFAKHHIPIEVTEGKASKTQYAIVAAFPYSGVNSIDLYCYVFRGPNWRLYTVAFLINSTTEHVDVKQKQDAVEIWKDGNLAITLTLANGD